jgi:protein tyrosine/serine phosphatase
LNFKLNGSFAAKVVTAEEVSIYAILDLKMEPDEGTLLEHCHASIYYLGNNCRFVGNHLLVNTGHL